MITKKEYDDAVKRVLQYFADAHIAVTDEERQRVEVADFGLGRLAETGLEILTYVNTDRVCSKEMVLFPYQSCPEHRHVSASGQPGKEETFRCRRGEVYLYVSGTPTEKIKAKLPTGAYTVFHEVVLKAGEQYTMTPDTLHWFQAGKDGAVISEFSTHSSDETDIFTDPAVDRLPKVAE